MLAKDDRQHIVVSKKTHAVFKAIAKANHRSLAKEFDAWVEDYLKRKKEDSLSHQN